MKRLWPLTVGLLITACSIQSPDKSKLPVWQVTLEIPLIEASVDLGSMLADSLISLYPTGMDGDSIFVFTKSTEIERVEVGDQLRLEPIRESFVQYATAVKVDSSTTSFAVGYDTVGLDDISKSIVKRMGLIELDNVQPERTKPFVFSEIMPATLISFVQNAITAMGGTAAVVIDTIALVPQQKSVQFDSFSSAVISSGFLDITLINNLFIPLGAPIYVDVKSSLGDSLFHLTWNTEIPVGDSAMQSQDLSGITLPGNLLVEVSGRSNGSHGDTLTVTYADLSSSFLMRLEARDFQVTQAHAIVPEQTVSDTGAITVDAQNTLVEEAVFRSAEMNLVITNELPLTGNMTLSIPSLYNSQTGSFYQHDFTVQQGMTVLPPADLSGWTLLMELAHQKLNYNSILHTDATGTAVIITEFDSVLIDMAITNITFKSVFGELEQQTIIDSGTININSDSRVQSARISAGFMDLEINNGIGGMADLQLYLPELLRAGRSVDTTLLIRPGANSHQIDLAGYTVVPVSLDDQRVRYHSTTQTRVGTYAYELLDSIDVVVDMKELAFESIVGYIDQENYVSQDSIDLDQATIVERASIESGSVQLTIRNTIGLAADVDFSIPELSREGAGFRKEFRVGADPQPVLKVFDLSGYTLALGLTAQQVHYQYNMTIPSDELLSLSLNDSIAVEVYIDTLVFSTVTGIIDTVQVQIDTVVQQLAPFPEEMSGFKYSDVEITIGFNSDITIPLLLDLTLAARNETGEETYSSVRNWSILDSPLVVLPDAEDLINIRPTQIRAWGTVHAGGGANSGTIAMHHSIAGMLTVRAPFAFEIGPNTWIVTEPEIVDEADTARSIPDELEEIMLFVKYANDFAFGAELNVLMSQDTASFAAGTADVLVDSLVLNSNSTGLDSVRIVDQRLDLFNQQSMFIQMRYRAIGQTDKFGDPVPTRFLSTDTLRLNLFGRLHYLMDGPALTGADE